LYLLFKKRLKHVGSLGADGFFENQPRSQTYRLDLPALRSDDGSKNICTTTFLKTTTRTMPERFTISRIFEPGACYALCE